MSRVALINGHRGSMAVSEALFESLGYKTVLIMNYTYHLLGTRPRLGHKILLMIRKRYDFVRKTLLRRPYSGGMYPAPIIAYRFLHLLGLIKDEDYVNAAIHKDLRGFTSHQFEHFSRICSTDKVLKSFFKDIDYIATSYPPRLIHLVKILADEFNLKLIVLSGHRFNIAIRNRAENEAVKNILLDIHQSPQHTFAAAALYDSMYTKHYLNIEPKPLFHFSFHITQKIEQPDNNVVLVGPTNAAFNSLTKPYREQIEQTYSQFCDDNGLTPKFTFQFIRAAYPVKYELNQLARHPAIIIMPYSVFSYSQEELYDLNIPYFVPSVDFLIQSGMVNDRTLSEWIGLELYKTIETDLEDDGSPNSHSEAAQRKWLPYASIYQKENAVIFNDLTDLARKIHTVDQDGDRLRQKMYAENTRRRDENLKLWSKALNLTPNR